MKLASIFEDSASACSPEATFCTVTAEPSRLSVGKKICFRSPLIYKQAYIAKRFVFKSLNNEVLFSVAVDYTSDFTAEFTVPKLTSPGPHQVYMYAENELGELALLCSLIIS
jgi:hypothetical protein